ncbi:Exoenzyme S synthesis protein B [compost metagenome]
MKAFLCILAACWSLGGCVSVPRDNADFIGRIDFAQPLTKAGYLTLQLYTHADGQLRLVGQQRYRVNMLPLYYDFTASSLVLSQGVALIKGELSWSEGGAVQAQVLKAVQPGKSAKLKLKPLLCYPGCVIDVVQ